MRKFSTIRPLVVLALFLVTTTGPLFAQNAERPKPITKPTINIRKFYDYRGALRKNSVKIQPIALLYALKVSYERVVERKVSVGLSASYFHGSLTQGSLKTEVVGKYFLRYRAPLGIYAFATQGVANIRNHHFQYRSVPNEGSPFLIPDSRTPLMVEEKANFSTYIGSVGLGFHNILGPDRNIIVDMGLGYQFYSVPSKFKKPIERNGITYNQFGANNVMLGPTSPLQARFAFGFMF